MFKRSKQIADCCAQQCTWSKRAGFCTSQERYEKAPRALQLNIFNNFRVHSNGPDTSYKVYTRGGILKNSFKSEDLVDMRNVHFPFLQDIDCRTTTIRIHRKSQSFKLHDRTQAGPPKELQCARAMENVRIINASAKEQESLTQPNVTQQLLDLTRLNLEGLVAYTFSFSTRSPL